MLKIEKERLLLDPTQFKPCSKNFEVIGAFNPGALRLRNGDILLYVRIAERLKKWEDKKYVYSPRFVSDRAFRVKIDRFKKDFVAHIDRRSFHFKDGALRLNNISHFRRVWLDKSGFEIKKIEQKPFFFGTPMDGELGIEDSRITKLGGNYIMTYVGLSRFNSISSSYALSRDGLHWHRRGIIFRHQNKDVVIFPKKIKNRYVALNRPEGNFEFSLPHMWISFSKDLEYWGDDKSILVSKDGWDATRIGAGCPPIETEKGWLELYHGVYKKDNKKAYCMGAAIFGLKNPERLIARGPHDEPLLLPRCDYEKQGFMKNVIFPTGLIVKKDKLLVYSGGADRVTSIKEIYIEEIIKHLKEVG